jgi:hypothetical protein
MLLPNECTEQNKLKF